MLKKGLFTGSRIYGTPTGKSDLDLVLKVNSDDLELLKNSAPDSVYEFRNGTISFRFGNLNIIAVKEEHIFKGWASITLELMLRKPVSKEESIKTFNEAGVTVDAFTGSDGTPLDTKKDELDEEIF